MICPGPSAVVSAVATAATLHVGIIAGGVGQRFRPYSSDELPKQFLPITHKDRTMLQVTLDRFEGVVPPERIWIATNDRYMDLVAEQAPDVPRMNIIGEPVKRNTAPAIATLMNRIASHGDDTVGAIMPADHYIADVDMFRSQLLRTAKFALDSGFLCTFGIKPTWASPDYGYINAGKPDKDDPSFLTVDRFVEKPEPKVAKGYLKEGNYYWNSGMFVWGAQAFLEHLYDHQPVMAAGLDAVYGNVLANTPLSADKLLQYFGALHGISIDYALMEPASKDGYVAMLPFETWWSDVGTWEGLKSLVDTGRAEPPAKVIEIMNQELAKEKG
jgi:mannose-1-phosphate guanylyltransferase